MHLLLSLALAQEPLSDLPKKPVGEGMFGVVVQVIDAVPTVLVADVEVPLVDDGTGADAVAGDGVWSGEVPAPGSGTVVVLVGDEEGFRDHVPLNAGERVRVLMTERGPNLTFEPAEFEEPTPPEQPPPPEVGPPEGAAAPEVVLPVVGLAVLLGLVLGVVLGRTVLAGRGGRPVVQLRGGEPVSGGVYGAGELDLDRLLAEGRTLVLRERLDLDGVLRAADDNPGALVVAFAEQIDGDLDELVREGLPNLVILP